MEIQQDTQYMDILSQSNVRCIRALKNIQKPNKTSSFLNRLEEAKKIGNDWEGRDIMYYAWNQQLKSREKLQSKLS